MSYIDVRRYFHQYLNEAHEGRQYKRRAQAYLKREHKLDKDAADRVIEAVRTNHNITRWESPKAKFLPGLCRLMMAGEISDVESINQMNSALKYVTSSAHYDEYSEDLNGLSLDEIFDRFAPQIDGDAAKHRRMVASKEYGNRHGYEIVKITDEEQAQEYAEYCEWCITQDSFETYNLDTINQCYFCLKPGFESMKKTEGEGCPLDAYGMSMVSVLVDPYGEPFHITTRWNHEHDGEDVKGFSTPPEVSDILDVDFYKTFKPNTMFKDALARLDAQISRKILPNCAKDIGGGAYVLRLYDRYNILKDWELMFPKWSSFPIPTEPLEDGCSTRPLNIWNGKLKLMRPDGTLDDAPEGIASATMFRQGVSIVKMIDGKTSNAVDEKFRPLLGDGTECGLSWLSRSPGSRVLKAAASNDRQSLACRLYRASGGKLEALEGGKVFDRTGFPDESGECEVYMDGKVNIILPDGTYKIGGFQKSIMRFRSAAGIESPDGKWALCDPETFAPAREGFDEISDTRYVTPYMLARKGDKWKLLNASTFEDAIDGWHEEIIVDGGHSAYADPWEISSSYEDGITVAVKDGGLYRLVDPSTGKAYSPPFDKLVRGAGFGAEITISRGGKQMWVDKETGPLTPWFDKTLHCTDRGVTALENDGKIGFLLPTGKGARPEMAGAPVYWFDKASCRTSIAYRSAEYVINGYIHVEKDGKRNQIDASDGTLVMDAFTDMGDLERISDALVRAYDRNAAGDNPYAVLDRSGRETTPERFYSVGKFRYASGKLACVSIREPGDCYERFNFIDRSGRLALDGWYHGTVGRFGNTVDEKFPTLSRGGRAYLLTDSGRLAPRGGADSISALPAPYNGVGIASDEGGKWLMDSSGKAITGKFEAIYCRKARFGKSVAYAWKDGRSMLIDCHGEPLTGWLEIQELELDGDSAAITTADGGTLEVELPGDRW